jgi:hypothetical protein
VGKLKEKEENGKAQNKSKKGERCAFQYTFRQFKIETYIAICLLKKLSSMTVYKSLLAPDLNETNY